MQCLLLFAALMALATAHPFQFSRSTEKCPEEFPQYQDVKRNQSSVLALQLAGSATSDTEVNQTCSQLNAGGSQRLFNQGLYPDVVQNTTCNAQASPPNATAALPDVVIANTQIFTNQIIHSFASTNQSNLKYLCKNLRYVQLSSFLLDDTTIINATCVAGDGVLAPEPFTTLAQINQSAVDAYHNAASKIYAYQSASRASRASELQTACSAGPSHHANWKALQLNATLVEDTLCSIKQPLSTAAAKSATLKWTTSQFLAVLENISNAPGYRRWLCEELDVQAMDRVALDGKLAKRAACAFVRKAKKGKGKSKTKTKTKTKATAS